MLAILLGLIGPVESAVSPARKCAAGKNKATAAKVSAKLACYRTAVTKSIDVDPDCIGKAEAKFAKAWAKLEAKGGCATTGDADDLEATVDGFVVDVVTALAVDATPSAGGTPGPTATPAPTPICASPLTHSNGLGNDYLDCSPLGTPGDASTYTVFMAMEARDAWPVSPAASRSQACAVSGVTASCVAKRTKTACAVWCYSGSVAGFVHAVTDRSLCQCPTSSDLSWN